MEVGVLVGLIAMVVIGNKEQDKKIKSFTERA